MTKKITFKDFLTVSFKIGSIFSLILFCFLFVLALTLPSSASLKDVQLQEPLRIFTHDDQLIAEFGEIHRIPASLHEMPPQLLQAILATEDQRFFSHPGVDPIGLFRAGFTLLTTGEKQEGGSTITMQVARNFFLTRKKTFSRKIKEILLAIKIDWTLSKEKILELYLNKVFYGHQAYGIAAAAKIYYGKSLDQLTLPEIAMLTGLPKAPSALNPLTNPKAAKERRNHVLRRMLESGYIDQLTYETAITAPVTAKYHGIKTLVQAPYIAEMVRQSMIKRFGDKTYVEGFNVYTTIDSKQQIAANRAIQKALFSYDKRHGYRKPEQNFGSPDLDKLEPWINFLRQQPIIHGLQPAIVLMIQDKSAIVLLKNGSTITIPWSGLQWARKQIIHDDEELLGVKPERAADILKVGDMIRVKKDGHDKWHLGQIPQIEAALISLNPKNGAILSLVGGFDYYHKSKFNRAIQAERQIGSSFKPFIYSAALEKGLTLATLINDAPIVVPDSGENHLWRPENSSHTFYGPTRLRVALMKSRNLVSIRLLQTIGIQYTIDYAARFGFHTEQLPHSLSLALGTADVTPLQMTIAYATFANGGYRITPYFIDRITSFQNTLIDQTEPLVASYDDDDNNNNDQSDEVLPKTAPRVISPQNAYIMTSALKDVIRQGTARKINTALHRSDLAGKTGTTNDKKDTWFCGFNKNLVATVWAGSDQSLPVYEYASQLAVPLWIDFMRVALEDQPEATLPTPPGIITVRINKKTGLLATDSNQDTMFEIFRQEFAPQEQTSPSSSVDMTTDDESESNINQLY